MATNPAFIFTPGLLALAEPNSTALVLVIFGALIAVSVLFSRAISSLGVPIVLLFLVLGMLGGSEGIGRIHFEDYGYAARMGTIALVLILFEGGLGTSVRSVRQVLYPATMLATVGVALTAGLVAAFAHAMGLQWPESLLLGAVVSSTDAAAVFAVLRGGKLHLEPRVGRTIEVESCVNDPMAVILTLSIIGAIQSHGKIGPLLLINVPVQLAVGTGVGIIVGWLGTVALRRIRLATVGLYPALTLSVAFLSYGIATLAWGSGFLAVFVAALVLGSERKLPYASGLMRIHDALAWLSQIGMFLMLGLLVFPSRLRQFDVALPGLAVGLFLAIVARPIAVVACLAPFRTYTLKQMLYIGWVGLRGAVPIILATFPVLAHVRGADRIFDLVFFIVVVSSLIPGATIRYVTKRLKLDVPERPTPEAVLEINATHPLGGEMTSFYIEPVLAVCGAQLSEIEFPPAAAVALIIRGREVVAARGGTTLQPGDHVYVFFQPQDRPFIELLFGQPEEG